MKRASWIGIFAALATACAGSGADQVWPASGQGPAPVASGRPPVDGAPPPPCTPQPADDGASVFVAPTGSDDAACGARTSPCKTVQRGIERAHAQSGKSAVVVARGRYVESITLRAGLDVHGGWDVRGDAWTQTCASDATVIQTPADKSVAVTADTLGGAASLTSLSLAPKDHAALRRDESVTGVFARGASTSLTLAYVVVATGNAGDGADGDAGFDGDVGGSSCASGTGASGTVAGARGAGAPAGQWSSDGYAPSAGVDGAKGTPGQNGTGGAKGACLACVGCNTDGDGNCSTYANGNSCGRDGTAGCGGEGGNGGGGGHSGGSAVALFAWDARVTLVGGSLTAGDGGRGGAGGPGGQGGAGGEGVVGADGTSCAISCGSYLGVCSGAFNKQSGAGGAAGGRGGQGAAGGVGGGGGGGASFAIVTGGNGNVEKHGTTLAHGAAGKAAQGGAPGQAGDVGP